MENLTVYGFIGLFIWNLVQEFRSGNMRLNKKIREDEEKRIKQLEEILEDEREASETFKKEMSRVVEEYQKEVLKLRATLEEKELRNQDLKALLQDKNPEVVKVLQETLIFLKSTDEQNKRILAYQTDILEEQKERNKRIDEASKNHTGDLTRVPKDESATIKP